MDLELKGKVAVVGGASKGLGRACAQVLAQEGARVVICSRSKPDLEKAAQEIRDSTGSEALAFAGDLDGPETIRDLIAAAVQRFGRLDILVNNSGGPPLARAHNATEEQWATALQRSLLFFARMCREAMPHLKKSGSGRIINILAATVYNPIPNLALSGVTRLGVVAFAKSLADEVGRDGVLINNVCPGSIMTERMLSNVTSRAKELGISVDDALEQRAQGHRGRPRRQAGGVRVPGGLPGLQPVELHHRDDDAGRRRSGALSYLKMGGPEMAPQFTWGPRPGPQPPALVTPRRNRGAPRFCVQAGHRSTARAFTGRG